MTPTTALVSASERTPTMFRPSSQAQMIPADAANPAATQSMLPAMGDVRSGNGFDDNMIAAEGRQFAAQRNARRKWAGKRKNVQELRKALAKVEAQLQSVSATGSPIPQAQLRKLQEARRKLTALIKEEGRTDAQAGGKVAAPWMQRPLIRKTMTTHQRLPSVPGPQTPDPLIYEPGAFSTQRNMRTIEAMQANVQPVVGMRQMLYSERANRMATPAIAEAGVQGWATEEMIPNVPNWALAAAGGSVLLLLLMKRRAPRVAVVRA